MITTLADRRVFLLSQDRWDTFMEALDRPAREIPGLRKLFETASVLDHERRITRGGPPTPNMPKPQDPQ